MITLKIYDPAMCCSSGVCGPAVDDKLVQFSNFLNGLDKDQYQVQRYNLSQQPEAYASNDIVNKILQEKGTDALPLIFVDDQLVSFGDYPSADQLGDFLKTGTIKPDDNSSGCCSGGCCG